MPGYNHYPSCTCGWCSGGGGRPFNNLDLSDLRNFTSYTARTTCVSTSNTDSARTHRTICWWCGAEVYYHTNGYGDSVLFDSLGSPWQVHSCWDRHREGEKDIQIFEMKVDEFKILILAGAIRKLQEDGAVPTEESVALEMGLSIESLKKNYSDFYVIIPRTYGHISLRQGF